MIASWVLEETRDINLQDKRLNERLTLLLSRLGNAPQASIPAACEGYAETAAAYRFFDNDSVDFENILEPHILSTYRRMAEHDVVVLAQDTTEIELTRPQQRVEGAGTLDGRSRTGALLHPLVAFTPDGTPLGTVAAEAWVRDEEAVRARQMTRAERQQVPIEEKESLRWVSAVTESQQVARDVPETKFVTVADSEADIYELLQEAHASPADDIAPSCGWIVRACQDRALQKAQDEHKKLREHLLTQKSLYTSTIPVRGRKQKYSQEKQSRKQSRNNRTAKVEVRAATVTLRPPYRPDRKLEAVTVNVVLVSEVNPPADEPAIEWILLTNESVDTAKDVQRVIELYTVRWLIEVFFRVLKSGCRIEKRRFEHIDRVFSALATYMIVAWRTLYVCRLGRQFPDIDCEAVFEPHEWKAVYCVVTGKTPPQSPPSLRETIRLVGELGGYVNRQREDEPGPQTIALGLQRLADMAACWQAFGPGAQQRQLV